MSGYYLPRCDCRYGIKPHFYKLTVSIFVTAEMTICVFEWKTWQTFSSRVVALFRFLRHLTLFHVLPYLQEVSFTYKSCIIFNGAVVLWNKSYKFGSNGLRNITSGEPPSCVIHLFNYVHCVNFFNLSLIMVFTFTLELCVWVLKFDFFLIKGIIFFRFLYKIYLSLKQIPH